MKTKRLAVPPKFYEGFDARVAAEARWLASAGATVVVADVPPLACAAAARGGHSVHRAGQLHLGLDLPRLRTLRATRSRRSLDIIDHGLCDDDPRAASAAARRLRAMADVVLDIPFIARRSNVKAAASVRAALGVDDQSPRRAGVVRRSPVPHAVRDPAADGRADDRRH